MAKSDQSRVAELLAPAGDWEALRAGVANGADAVYFGLERFNARRRATNFAVAELPEVIGYLHDHNVKGYVTFNTLVFSEELPRAAEYARAIAEAGADAVIVQDLGLIELLRRMVPTLPIHASTQMTQTAAGGIEELRKLGVARVILARELSLAEIGEIARATTMPLEVFVHGALCISYSGQCLASEALWGRSANRGECAQACRLPYELVVDGQPRGPSDLEYPLSPQDLAAHDRILQLVALGVAAFKIEGRLKRAEYVAAATGVYRAAIDAAVRGEAFAISAEQRADLVQSFSRGLSHGYLDGADHRKLVQGQCPKKRGTCVGRVVAKTAAGVVAELTSPLKPGDGVVFDDGRPQQDEQGGRVFSVEPVRGTRGSTTPSRRRPTRGRERFELGFGRDDVNLAAIAVGGRIWKTDDPAVRRRLEATFARDVVVRRVPLRTYVSVSVDKRLAVTLADDAGGEVEVSWPEPLQSAKRHPVTVEMLREQFGRLGDTPFELAGIELRGPDGSADSLRVMAPKSVLNELRRRAVQALRDQRAATCRHGVAEPDALTLIRAEITAVDEDRSVAESGAIGTAASVQLGVLTRSTGQFEAALAWRPSEAGVTAGPLYCDFRDFGECEQAVAAARVAGRAVGIATPRILHPGGEAMLEHIARLSPDVVLVRNLGGFSFLRRQVPAQALVGDHTLNVANEIAADRLARLGLTRLTPSYDLDRSQLAAMVGRSSPALFEVVVHQRIPMFHTRHCVWARGVSGAANCADCGQPCAEHELDLRDRIGALHPVLVDSRGANTVFNARVQSATELIPELLAAGLRDFRIELVRESAEQTRVLLDLYERLLSGSVEPGDALRAMRAMYPAGVTLGTLDAARRGTTAC